MGDSKPTSTPISLGTVIDKDENGKHTEAPYQELIGALLYLANTVRPDISFSVSKLSRFSSDPRESHWTAAKRVLRYLQGSKSLGIEYERSGQGIIGYSD